MALSTALHLIIATFLALHLGTLPVHGQNCYYPNGELATEGDAQCSESGGACCPLNWQCMSNGLCYYDNEGYYGRYTCTDQTWQSPSCPQICTHGNTATGNEAILQCSNRDWCCDGNRVSFNCCTKADTNYFSLPDPSPIAYISSVPSPTMAKTVHNSPASASDGTPVGSIPPENHHSSSSPSSSSLFSSESLTSTSSRTVTQESTTTGADGSASTVTRVVTLAPASVGDGGESSRKDHHDNPNLGLIVGLAVGIPVALILLGIAIFFAVRKMRESNRYHAMHRREQVPPTPANYADIPPGTHAPEADSFPVADARSKEGRTSELYGSPVLYSPNASINTRASLPPQYSPGSKEPMAQIPEAPQELWGDPGSVAHRPGMPQPPEDEMMPKYR